LTEVSIELFDASLLTRLYRQHEKATAAQASTIRF
jgi:hypothetical protein